jgi:hypothetical protein
VVSGFGVVREQAQTFPSQAEFCADRASHLGIVRPVMRHHLPIRATLTLDRPGHMSPAETFVVDHSNIIADSAASLIDVDVDPSKQCATATVHCIQVQP